ncbi:hypothetical protein NC661_04960 [Aquibacillus koreensis]|uniref:Uncharacterized protein n=1 Tax=Aquibacillus koreensis TaxID=279446 RepID=A0A9X3WLT5_9BACI|nr:hypothetical protein [Aquibacillus koreensis]MCT2534675.1 hypothetical protein [Aquibacillus koreensis]MDC3419714.1 hypothetical protein [Aquibacillus koreensis]
MTIPLQVHSGDRFMRDLFAEVYNEETGYSTVFRPQGGYWLSEYMTDDDYPSPWLHFIYNNPDMIKYHSRPYYSIYRITEDAKIYTINTYTDFVNLIVNYPLRIEGSIFIDFEKLSKDYDGVHLTSEGFENCSIAHMQILDDLQFDGGNTPTLRSWEVPSFLVMNPDILLYLDEKENERYEEDEGL